jgi:hypothetical protein
MGARAAQRLGRRRPDRPESPPPAPLCASLARTRARTHALPARTPGRGSLACAEAFLDGRRSVALLWEPTLCGLIAEMHARTRLGAARDVVLNVRLNGVVRGTFNVSRTGERCHERLHARVRTCACVRAYV